MASPSAQAPAPVARLSAEVLERFRSGDAAAVRQVYDAYARLVYAVARNTLGSDTLAQEATQQTFVKAWKAAAQFDSSRELGPWLATIAKRTALDIHRAEARRAATSLDATHPAEGQQGRPTSALLGAPDAQIEQLPDVWAVREAIERLPDDERVVVRMQHLDQLTHAEIAERLGLALGTVKSRSFRAHHRLAGLLGYLRENA